MNNNKFWAIKESSTPEETELDLFGYVGGASDAEWLPGFNENEFVKTFRKIAKDGKINISINSFGGSVFTALSIYSLLSEHKGEITFRVNGVAMSAASIITSVPQAKVIMPEGALMMIHRASCFTDGNAEEIQKTAEDLAKIDQNLLDIYARKCGKKPEDIKPYLDAESYFTAREAVEFGLADEVDANASVSNIMHANEVVANGLVFPSRIVAKAPIDIFTKEQEPKATKEEKVMTIEELQASQPELVETLKAQAREEGVNQERERLKAIEDIAIEGFDDMVKDAKYGVTMTAPELAVAILKAGKERKVKLLIDRAEDAKDLAQLPTTGNMGLVINEEQKAKEQEEENLVIQAGAKAFRGI